MSHGIFPAGHTRYIVEKNNKWKNGPSAGWQLRVQCFFRSAMPLLPPTALAGHPCPTNGRAAVNPMLWNPLPTGFSVSTHC